MANELRRFNRVLKVREVERDIVQSELVVWQKQEEGIVQRIQNIETQKSSALSDFCSGKERLISPQELWYERQNLDILERRLGDNKEELAECRSRIEQTQTELLEKHRDVQILEKHVGKIKDSVYKSRLAAEQNSLDDITIMRFMRKQGV